MHQQSVTLLNYSLLLDYVQVETWTYKSIKIPTSPGDWWRDVWQRTGHDSSWGRLLRWRRDQLHGIPRVHRRFRWEKRHQRSQQESPLWEAEANAAEHWGLGMLLKGSKRGWGPPATPAQVQIKGMTLEFCSDSVNDPIEMVPKIWMWMQFICIASHAYHQRPFWQSFIYIGVSWVASIITICQLLCQTASKVWCDLWNVAHKSCTDVT